MLEEVRRHIRRQTAARARILAKLNAEQRRFLISLLIKDFFSDQRRTLLKWASLTGQSAQIDTGYVSQYMASVCLGVPGQGFKGKGLDLVDGSEVKSAAILGGVDRPRWNHNLGTLAQDATRARKGLEPTWKAYLDAPGFFYVLFDRVVSAEQMGLGVLRVRGWYVDAQADANWRDLFERYIASRTPGKYNLQLHPPVGYNDDIVVNTMGNLDFRDTKVLEVRFEVPDAEDDKIELDWIQNPTDPADLPSGLTHRVPYGGRNSRPSRLEGAAAFASPDEVQLDALFPGLGLEETIAAYDPAAPDAAAAADGADTDESDSE